MQYVVGSKIVHPRLGAGTVLDIQKKSIGDTDRVYYIIDPIARSMQLMVPVDRAEGLGLRPAKEAPELRGMLSACSVIPRPEDIVEDRKARRESMREDLKSGSFSDVVGVVRKLFFLNSERPLGSADRQLLAQGKELLAGELALALDWEMKEALHEVEGRLTEMLDVEDVEEH